MGRLRSFLLSALAAGAIATSGNATNISRVEEPVLERIEQVMTAVHFNETIQVGDTIQAITLLQARLAAFDQTLQDLRQYEDSAQYRLIIQSIRTQRYVTDLVIQTFPRLEQALARVRAGQLPENQYALVNLDRFKAYAGQDLRMNETIVTITGVDYIMKEARDLLNGMEHLEGNIAPGGSLSGGSSVSVEQYRVRLGDWITSMNTIIGR